MSNNHHSSSTGSTGGMGFIEPLALGLGHISTNVPASDLPAWAAGTTYALGAEVVDSAGRIWRSLAAANQGHDPAQSPDKWQQRGYENRLRMFDASLGAPTQHADAITVTITPGRVVTDLWLTGVRAHWVQLQMWVSAADGAGPDELVFDSGQRLMVQPSGNSFWGYFFAPLQRQGKLHIGGLPAYVQARLELTISNQGGIAQCSECVLGRATWLGETRFGASWGFDDWGVKGRDEWGGWQITPGAAYSERVKLQLLVRGVDYERVRHTILAQRARPVVWLGARGYDVLTVYGYATNFEQVLFAHGYCDCNLTIEGLENHDNDTPLN